MRVLSELEVGEVGVLVALNLPPGVQNHLMYMGFVPDARVKALHRAPAGDPTVYSVDGIEIAIRRETAKSIQVQSIQVQPVQVQPTQAQPVHIAMDNLSSDAADTSLTEELTEAVR